MNIIVSTVMQILNRQKCKQCGKMQPIKELDKDGLCSACRSDKRRREKDKEERKG